MRQQQSHRPLLRLQHRCGRRNSTVRACADAAGKHRRASFDCRERPMRKASRVPIGGPPASRRCVLAHRVL
ncbi:hypothetical protein BBJ41_30385 [Burkholderia stabilis]|nr:hypothetical protein BBJ41_30385 [Burkholderia stabilis]